MGVTVINVTPVEGVVVGETALFAPPGPTGATGVQGEKGLTGDGSVYEVRGSGMPNGVVTADPGTYYTDTVGTNGAWRWLKKAGTGNTGWECVIGDTGWRTTYNYTQDETSWSTGTIQVRRTGDTVAARFQITSTAGTGAAVAADVLSTGFQVPATSTSVFSGLLALNGGAVLSRVTFYSNDLYFWGPHTNAITAFARSVTSLRGSLTWVTNDPWPTVLPGVAD